MTRNVGRRQARYGGLRVPSARRRQRGTALVLVMGVALLLGLAALSLTFTVTLDSLAARNAQEMALAEGQAEGALAIETSLVYASVGAATGATGSKDLLRSLGWSVQIARLPVSADAESVIVRARVGRAVVVRSAALATRSAAVHLLARF